MKLTRKQFKAWFIRILPLLLVIFKITAVSGNGLDGEGDVLNDWD